MDKFEFRSVNKINLISNRSLYKEKIQRLLNSRILYFLIFFYSYFPLKRILNNDKPDYLIVHLITSIPLLMFILNNFKTELILRISGLPKLNFHRFLLWKIASKKIKYVICPTEDKRFFIKKEYFKKIN